MQMKFTTDLLVFSSPDRRLSEVCNEGHRTYHIEEPKTILGAEGTYHLRKDSTGQFSVTPYLPKESSVFEKKEFLLGMLRELMFDEGIHDYSVLTETPKTMALLRTLSPLRIVYRPMEKLSKRHPELEAELLEYADEVLKADPSGHELNPAQWSRAQMPFLSSQRNLTF